MEKESKEYDVIEESLETVPAMLRHRMVTDVLSEWHRDLGLPKHEFKHLSVKEARKPPRICVMRWTGGIVT